MKRVVILGGGSGTSVLARGLKDRLHVSVVVSMADDGGSSGILRRELSVLPPGNLRQNLLALSDLPEQTLRALNERFPTGALKGHALGNLLIAGFELSSADFNDALDELSRLFQIRGQIIPATLAKVRLLAKLKNGHTVRGESALEGADLREIKKLVLEPIARANQRALDAVRRADAIVIAPGDFYRSVLPSLLADGLASAINKSEAVKIFVVNLSTQAKQTDGWTPADFARALTELSGVKPDYILYNTTKPNPAWWKKYASRYQQPVKTDRLAAPFIGAPLLSDEPSELIKADPLVRNRIKHDPAKLLQALRTLL